MKHIILTMLAMLATQAGATGLRAVLNRHAPYAAGEMKVYDGDKLLFEAESQGLNCITQSKFSHDGRWLLNIADGCGYVQLWDVQKGQRLKTFLAPGHQYELNYADFLPDSKSILLSFLGDKSSVTLDKKPDYFTDALRESSLWDIATLKRIAIMSNFRRQSAYHGKVSFSTDGRLMVFADIRGYDPASIWNTKTGAYISTIPRLPYPNKDRGGAGSQDARLSPDGQRVLVLYVDGRLAEYDVKNAKLLKVRGKPTDAQEQLDRFAKTGH